ncbi:hypothetical protein [Marinospirillum sp.]|uniref:hypothetical protein n=1 Tax=Marinospirillum sp. TaxID=2183934 RepID=UPI00286FB3DA|nr:hypothetical protein [Marinospirillum sp.]MDR9467910.1 hypothetical protein [Marinospirillum sp.]
MKKTAWIVYGSLWLLLILAGWVMSVYLLSGSELIVPTFTLAFTLLYLTALYGYVFVKAIWKRKAWRFLFWWFLLGIVMQWALLLFTPSVMGLIEVAVLTLFAIPFIYALNQYSSIDNAMWGEASLDQKRSDLDDLFATSNTLMASVISTDEESESKTAVTLKNEESQFLVEIYRTQDDQEDLQEKQFSDLSAAVQYIEENTPIRARDFH